MKKALIVAAHGELRQAIYEALMNCDFDDVIVTDRVDFAREQISECEIVYINFPLRTKLEDIKLLNRAKSCLISYLGMTEPQAHRYIQKHAMDARITPREVSEEILKTYEY